jgi:hypothetical protein
VISANVHNNDNAEVSAALLIPRKRSDTLVGLRGYEVLDEGVRSLGVEGQGVLQGLQLLRL